MPPCTVHCTLHSEYTETLYCHLPLTLLLVCYFDSFPLFCKWTVLLYGAIARLFLFRFVSLTSDFIFILIPFHFIKLFSTWVTSLYWAILFHWAALLYEPNTLFCCWLCYCFGCCNRGVSQYFGYIFDIFNVKIKDDRNLKFLQESFFKTY